MSLRSASLLDPLRHARSRALNVVRDYAFLADRLKERMAARSEGGGPCPVDRAIVSSNLHPDYAFCIPLVVLFWNRLHDVRCTLLTVGKKEEWLNHPLGSLVLFDMPRSEPRAVPNFGAWNYDRVPPYVRMNKRIG